MKLIANLGKVKDGRDALILEKAGHLEYLLARNFDSTKEMGQAWDSAAYFYSLDSFSKAILEIESEKKVVLLTGKEINELTDCIENDLYDLKEKGKTENDFSYYQETYQTEIHLLRTLDHEGLADEYENELKEILNEDYER